MKTFLVACTLVLAVSACGEHPQTIVYKQGEYQGKTDMRPQDNPPWNGDKQAWLNDLRARGQNQNEYKRVN